MSYTGWIGTALVFVSLVTVGQKRRSGFLVGALAEVFWFLYGIHLGSFELSLMAVVFIGVYLRNYYLWGNNGQSSID